MCLESSADHPKDMINALELSRIGIEEYGIVTIDHRDLAMSIGP